MLHIDDTSYSNNNDNDNSNNNKNIFFEKLDFPIYLNIISEVYVPMCWG